MQGLSPQVQWGAVGAGWGQLPEDALRLLPGPHFERRQQDAGDEASSSTLVPSAAAGAVCQACASSNSAHCLLGRQWQRHGGASMHMRGAQADCESCCAPATYPHRLGIGRLAPHKPQNHPLLLVSLMLLIQAFIRSPVLTTTSVQWLVSADGLTCCPNYPLPVYECHRS